MLWVEEVSKTNTEYIYIFIQAIKLPNATNTYSLALIELISLAFVYMVFRFSPHGKDAPDLTAGWNDNAIQRQERSSFEQLSGEWAQVNAQVTPLSTFQSNMLKLILMLEHLSDAGCIVTHLSTHNVSLEADKRYSGMQRSSWELLMDCGQVEPSLQVLLICYT